MVLFLCLQVECSPLSPDQKDHTKDILKLEELVSENFHNKEDKEIDSAFKKQKDDCSNYECENSLVKTKLKYLETDIDQLESCDQFLMNKKEKSVIELNDVRSPTYQISRTPIMVSYLAIKNCLAYTILKAR